MTSVELDNLVRIGKLKREPASAREIQGLRESARARLTDAGRDDLSFDNLAEYEGYLEHDQKLLDELIAAAQRLFAFIEALPLARGPEPMRCT